MTNESWPSTHQSLIVRVKDPTDSAAWSAFVTRYRQPIVRFCCRRGLQEATAEDVAQEILLKLLRAMQRLKYDPNRSFRGWLKTVIKNAVFDYLKEEGKRLDAGSGNPAILQVLEGWPAGNEAHELTNTLSDDLRRDLLQQAEEIVRTRMRNEKNWQAYCLRKEGQSAQEIADRLEMSVGAVHKAKSRVMDFLRAELSNFSAWE